MEKKEFLRLTVHEVKTPISIIHGFADLINYDIISGDELKETAFKIQSEAERLSKLVDELAYYLGIEENVIEAEFVTVDLKTALEEAASAIRKSTDENVDIIIEGDGSVCGSYEMLEVMVFHLIENGILYNNSDVKKLVCRIGKDIDKVVLSIEDNGVGIKEEERKAVFGCFYRVDKAWSRGKGGNGMGLPVCERIAHVHKAQIEIGSALGNGTTVTVKF